MEQELATQQGGGPNPLDQRGLCLLSLDGGGVRGLSTLYILKSLMRWLNEERKNSKLPPVKPCEVFDLIGGTSTGGLIAIMLGRLEMDVDECIQAYCEVMESIFDRHDKRKPYSSPVNLRGKINPKYDHKALERAIEKVIASRGYSKDVLFDDEVERGCRVFVCATAQENRDITRLRSYSLFHEEGVRVKPTICQAALATSAATSFFDPVSIGDRKFVDGALGANNPVVEVEGEAANIWCFNTEFELKPLVKCFVSIGTGLLEEGGIEDNGIKFFKTLADIVTETERSAESFVARWAHHFDKSRYFRFNVIQGLQQVGVDEYKKSGKIESNTEKYLKTTQQKLLMRNCVSNLKQKQKKTEPKFASIVYEYNRLRITKPLDDSSGGCWFVPLERNQKFVGRDSQLSKLEASLFVEGHCPKFAIIGLGGVGKTQIALELAYRTKDKHPECSVFWVPVISDESFQQAYIEIAHQLKIPGIEKKDGLGEDGPGEDGPGEDGPDVRELLQRYLSQESAGQWLLIFDNVDDIDMWLKTTSTEMKSSCLFNYLPRSNRGSIVFTTRSRKIAVSLASANVIDVAEMDKYTATQVLKKALINPEILHDQDTVLEFLDRLTSLPLAIMQAAAYINENGIGLSEYLSLLGDQEQNVIDILSEDFEDEGRYRGAKNAVATTWLISFEKIRDRVSLAIDYLSLMACVNPKAIPESFLPPAQSAKERIDAIGTLSAYSFVTKQPDQDSLELHRLVHLACRNWLRRKNLLAEWTEKTVERLADVFPKAVHERNMPPWRMYLPHVRHVYASDLFRVELKGSMELLEAFGFCLVMDSRLDEVEMLYKHMVDATTATLGKEHPKTLHNRLHLTRVYKLQGRLKEAENGEMQILETYKRVHGQEHPQVLEVMVQLAKTHYMRGRYKVAEKLLSQASEMVEKAQGLQGQENPSALVVMHMLALTYTKQGRWKEAESLESKVLEKKVRVLGKDHPLTLISMRHLAWTYAVQHRTEEAITLLKNALELHIHRFGEDHHFTEESRKQLDELIKEPGGRGSLVPSRWSALYHTSFMSMVRYCKVWNRR